MSFLHLLLKISVLTFFVSCLVKMYFHVLLIQQILLNHWYGSSICGISRTNYGAGWLLRRHEKKCISSIELFAMAFVRWTICAQAHRSHFFEVTDSVTNWVFALFFGLTDFIAISCHVSLCSFSIHCHSQPPPPRPSWRLRWPCLPTGAAISHPSQT